jgi:hypothetical protein
MVVDGAVVMVENIVRHLTHNNKENGRRCRENSRGSARGAATGLLRDSHHHHGLSAHLHAAGGRRPALPAHGLDSGLRSAGRSDLFHDRRSCPGQFSVPQGREGMEEPGDGVPRCALPEGRHLGHPSSAVSLTAAPASPAWLPRHLSLLSAASSAPSSFLTWMRARSGCAALSLKVRDPAKGSAWPIRPESCSALFLKRPNAPARRAARTTEPTTPGFFNTEYFVGLKPKGRVAPGFIRTKTT